MWSNCEIILLESENVRNMEKIVENNDKNQTEASNQTMLKTAAITSVSIF